MKILLFKPHGVSDSVTPVLGLGYLASSVRPAHPVRLVHGIQERVGAARFRDRVLGERPDLIGIQVYTHDLAVLPSYLDVLRRDYPSPYVVLGGPHPTAAPASSLSLLHGLKGFVLKGEADASFPELVRVLETRGDAASRLPSPETLKSIGGLAWGRDGEVRENPCTWIKDLDTIPFPAWDLIRPERLPPSPHAAFFKGFPVATMVASRGCPYPCTYCAGRLTMGKRMRYRSVGNVLDEVELLTDRYGVREIHFVDDNFTYRKSYVMRFCEEVRRRGVRVHWTCPNGVRLNTLDEELLRAMKGAGCYCVSVGIESGSQRVLDAMKKELTLGEIREKVGLIRRVGLVPIGFFMLGFPSETREEMAETLRFSQELGLKRANFMLFHPFPGTEAFRWIGKRKTRNGMLLTAPSYAEVSYVPEGFTAGELKMWQRKAFLGFYLRPAILALLLKDIRSARHAYWVFRRMFRWMRQTQS